MQRAQGQQSAAAGRRSRGTRTRPLPDPPDPPARHVAGRSAWLIVRPLGAAPEPEFPPDDQRTGRRQDACQPRLWVCTLGDRQPHLRRHRDHRAAARRLHPPHRPELHPPRRSACTWATGSRRSAARTPRSPPPSSRPTTHWCCRTCTATTSTVSRAASCRRRRRWSPPRRPRRPCGKWGFSGATGLDHWADWQTQRGDERLTITAVPGQHGPAGVHRLLPPVIGTVLDLETRSGDGWRRDLRVYVTGDTLNVPRLSEVTERFPDVDVDGGPPRRHAGLGVLVTMDDRQGTDLVERIRPRHRRPRPLRRLQRLRAARCPTSSRRWGGAATRRC